MSQTHSGTQLPWWLTGTPNTFMTLEIDLLLPRVLLLPKLVQSTGSMSACPYQCGSSDFVSVSQNLQPIGLKDTKICY